jgi:phage terminase large subunit
MRIEAARRVFLRCWFNETTTEAGRDALGYYHERRDPNRNVGLGPEHDWSFKLLRQLWIYGDQLRGAAG